MIRTRFAPSPTGDLHLGGAWTLLASWVLARRAKGALVLRVEDLDRPRVVPGSRERILEDIGSLGLGWDEGPIAQSERAARYEAALASLDARGLVYPCDCSRAEIALAASAPHPGEDTVYTGTCRDRDPGRSFRRPPALRLRVPDEIITLDDGVMGTHTQDLPKEVGDFVLKRGDGLFAYQLAVVVDDLEMGITDVVRGADLLASTPRQALLMRLLGAHALPRFWHVPLVVATDGERLAKRTPGGTVRKLLDAGVGVDEILGELACGLGLTDTNAPRPPAAIVASSVREPIAWRRTPWRIPARWAHVT